MEENTSLRLQNCIARMNAGDAAARDELLQHAGARLERLAHKMLQGFPRVRRWEDTGDVLQNALLRLLQSLREVKVESAQQFFALAALAIRRELLDLARHYYGPQGLGANQDSVGKQASSAETPPSACEPADSTYEPGQLAAWTQFHQQVDALPSPEREVFDLLWYQDLSQAEAAAVLGVSVPTVKRRWLAARLRLQQAIKVERQFFAR